MLTDAGRAQARQTSPVAGLYEQVLDRESAFEMLTERAERAAEASEHQIETKTSRAKVASNSRSSNSRAPSSRSQGRSSKRQSVFEAGVKSVVRSVGSQLGRALVRGLLGSLTR